MEKLGKIMLETLLVLLLVASSSSTVSGAYGETDFLNLILEWPGSQCNTKEGCCPPKTTKHVRDFIIAGVQPFYFNATFPKNCDPNNQLDISKISHFVKGLHAHWPSLTCPTGSSEKLWANEWQNYGTCSERMLNMRTYFKTALTLRKTANLLGVLAGVGIQPNGSFYEVDKILDAIYKADLGPARIECSKDKYGNLQLGKISLCTDYNGQLIVFCPPELPTGNFCGSRTVKFPGY